MTENTEQNFISICRERGFFHQLTDEEGLLSLLKKGTPVPAYIGFDCTAKSLHVGSLLQIMLLRWWQKTGNKPIVLMGGGTTKIGDPSGKDTSRPQLQDSDIQANMDSIKGVFKPFLTFGDSASDAVMVNNDEWLSKLSYIDLLRDVGRHFSVNQMLTMESVKRRLESESHMSFLEFNYMILQAYDFVELNQRYGCRVQMGGSDQWGNITQGTELNRRMAGDGSNDELFGITSPLLTTAAGKKMGKTESGAVWLNADMCSPYNYWQFWRNTEDADVGKFLKLFTELPMEEIARLESLEGAEINEAKKVLANEATTLLHGAESAKEAAETAQKTFELGATGDALPEVTVETAELEAGIPAFKIFQLAGLAESGKKARQLIQGGGARVNDVKVEDENAAIALSDMTAEGHIKLSAGKKKHALIKAT